MTKMLDSAREWAEFNREHASRLSDEVDTLRAEVERLTAEREEIFTKDRGRTAEHNILTRENRTLRAEVERLKEELANEDEWRVYFETKCETLVAEVEKLRAALQKADNALTQFVAFEDDCRAIMGNTNFRILKACQTEVRAALAEEKKG